MIEHFVAGSTARAASEVVGVNVKTATTFCMRLRHLIAGKRPGFELSGKIEADESYFGGKRKGKRGRVLEERSRYLVFSSAAAKFTQRLSRMQEPNSVAYYQGKSETG